MTEKIKREKLAKEWIDKASDDELSVKAILKEGGAPSTVCFLSQQMGEKYLKAFLVFHQKTFPKIHHLDILLELCADIDGDLEKLKDNVVLLSDYYIETRYPGGWVEIWTWKEAEEAFDAALEIKKIISGKFLFGLN